MKININEINFTIKEATDADKHQNLLAYLTLTFQEESGGYFTISGFTLWKSKFGGYNVEVPGKRGFKYCLIEKSLWRKIKEEIIEQYEYKNIPIIEEYEKK
jgi:hypothetical protein